MRGAVLLGALLLLAPAGGAEEAAPVSERPLWFSFELVGEPARVVFGYLDETKGTGRGYDVAVFDADGDGEPVTRGSHEVRLHRGPGDVISRREPGLDIRLPDRLWQVMFEIEWGGVTRRGEGVFEVGFSWVTSVDGGFVHFINGAARVYDTPDAAREAKPNRLGPPFHWV
ncbi:MAG: hypothetical protein GF328_06725, partial [Candidatus Latescibacteria bacterium]|nr:hypothetical protein [Candidatus Latescibacterota bacterium]